MAELVSLSYSPWSEKARWALDHHGLRYRETPFQPLLGEPGLRWRLGRWTERVSVPVFFDDDRWHTDSWQIAAYADRHGGGAPLLTDSHEVERFNRLSERALAGARALGLTRILGRDEWTLALVPRKLRPWFGPFALPVARSGIKRTLRKYGSAEYSLQQHHDALVEILEEVRATLGEGDDAEAARTLLDTFSYADIAIAQVMQMIAPANVGGFYLSAEGKPGYTDPELSERFGDLIAWRDALYRDHRRGPARG